MANKKLFRSNSKTSKKVQEATVFNNAGGWAYEMSPRHALAQIASTNTFNGTFYASGEANLELAKNAALQLKNDALFVAKAAIYSRTKNYMKDMPAFLMVVLAGMDTELFRKVFPQVIDNGKMLRNFIQIARSGVTGRTFNMSSGACRHAIRDWFVTRSADQIFRASVGNDPSMRDILRMGHPRPENDSKAALYAYLDGYDIDMKKGILYTLDKNGEVRHSHKFSKLPAIVRNYELYKRNREGNVPKVDFRMLDSLNLSDDEWVEIARNAGWTMTRMNLNTFARHKVFANKEVTKLIVDRLVNPEEIKQSKVFPYQLMAAYNSTENGNIPFEVRDALQEAMEIAVDNVPKINGKVYICVDTSGSMDSPITGYRTGSTTAVNCVDVAALFAASVLRKNPSAEVLPFDTQVRHVSVNGRDSIMTNAKKLALRGGGTDCSCALKHLNHKGAKGDLVVFVSDNESWVDTVNMSYARSTGLMNEWVSFQKRNPKAKLVCIDLTPRNNAQVNENKDILLIGGWSDSVYNVVAQFVEGNNSQDSWVAEIEKVDINKGLNTDNDE